MTPEELIAKGYTWENLAEKLPKQRVTFRMLHTVASELLRALKSSNAQIKALQQRIDSLEQRPSVQYRGIFKDATHYSVGDFCTFDGHCWACVEPTVGVRPSYHDPSQPRQTDTKRPWILAVKRGRDAR